VPYVVVRGARAVLRTGPEIRRAMIALRARGCAPRPGETHAWCRRVVRRARGRTGWGARSGPRPAAAGPASKWGGAGRVGTPWPRSMRRRPRFVPIGQAGAVQRDVSLAEFQRRAVPPAAEQQHAPTVEGVDASPHCISAKGLEWDGRPSLVGLSDGTLPTTYAKTPEQPRGGSAACSMSGVTPRPGSGCGFLYGQARFRRWAGPRRPCRFLPQLERHSPTERAGDRSRKTPTVRRPQGFLLPDLRRDPAGRRRPASWAAARPARPTSTKTFSSGSRGWRKQAHRPRELKIPAYVVFTDATPGGPWPNAARARPPELLAIAGIGPAKTRPSTAEGGLRSGGRREPRWTRLTQNFEN